MKNVWGYLLGIIASSTFGLIPLFSIPVLETGMSVECLLFYRYFITAVLVGGILLARKQSFKVERSQIPSLAFLVGIFCITAFFLIMSYEYIPSGVATTIHFLFPIVVTTLMVTFFGEQFSLFTLIAIVGAIAGVALLSMGEGGGNIALKGVLMVLVTVFTYAIYIVGVNKSKVQTMNGLLLTFYVTLGASALFFIFTLSKGTWTTIPSVSSGVNLFFLALVPTLISNLALIEAIKRVGSTTTAILGSMEPVTAVTVGIFVFAEPFSVSQFMGIVLIIAAVTLVILSKQLKRRIDMLVNATLKKGR